MKFEREIVNPFSEERRARISFICEWLAKNVPVERQKALAIIMQKYGTTEKTAREYLKTAFFIDAYSFAEDSETIIKEVAKNDSP